MNKTVKLNNGVEMPILGYGVYQIAPEECERCVLDAISVGYRSIDTAQAYYNEEGVGKAISKCGVPRDELFITTKIWVTNAGEEKFSAIRSLCVDLGITTMLRWMRKRKATCATDLLYFCPIPVNIPFVKKLLRPSAKEAHDMICVPYSRMISSAFTC